MLGSLGGLERREKGTRGGEEKRGRICSLFSSELSCISYYLMFYLFVMYQHLLEDFIRPTPPISERATIADESNRHSLKDPLSNVDVKNKRLQIREQRLERKVTLQLDERNVHDEDNNEQGITRKENESSTREQQQQRLLPRKRQQRQLRLSELKSHHGNVGYSSFELERLCFWSLKK